MKKVIDWLYGDIRTFGPMKKITLIFEWANVIWGISDAMQRNWANVGIDFGLAIVWAYFRTRD